MKIKDVEEWVVFINQIHRELSEKYFDQHEMNYNLRSTTLLSLYEQGGMPYVYRYRLFLHENINDKLTMENKPFSYRVKTKESIDEKLVRYIKGPEHGQMPVNKAFNDIMGFRIYLDEDFDEAVFDSWKSTHGLMRGYLRDKDGYVGYHLYFKNGDNRYFPWELQLWRRTDMENNFKSHAEHKRNFDSELTAPVIEVD